LNFHEWGLLDAIISDIADDLTRDSESGAYYSVKCKPVSSPLLMENGISAELRKGMSFSARIVVSRRSLLNLLFDKTDSWFDPYLAESK
jgi:HlyD family secretion protein